MPLAYVSIGSNIDRERNIRGALEALERRFGTVTVSPVYETEPVGFDGAPFYNLAAAFETTEDPRAVVEILHDIEERFGRERDSERFAPRTLDIDLLLYDQRVLHEPGLELPRPELLHYSFVLGPLADIAPDYVHPHRQQRLQELWNELRPKLPPLRPVPWP